MTPDPVKSRTHSVRAREGLWASARTRATREGLTMNHVLNEFLEGYAAEKLHLPEVVKVYPDTPEPVTAEK